MYAVVLFIRSFFLALLSNYGPGECLTYIDTEGCEHMKGPLEDVFQGFSGQYLRYSRLRACTSEKVDLLVGSLEELLIPRTLQELLVCE